MYIMFVTVYYLYYCLNLYKFYNLETFFWFQYVFQRKSPMHWLITIQIEHWMLIFSIFRDFSFTITLRQWSKGVTSMRSLCLVIQRCLRGTPLGFCLRVTVNEKPLNLSFQRHFVNGLQNIKTFLPTFYFQVYFSEIDR